MLGEKPNLDAIYVNRAQDFSSIIDANERLCNYLPKFNFVLAGHPANVNGQLFHELSNQAEIQERVNRQVSQGLSNEGE
jgi:hypothetical protein